MPTRGPDELKILTRRDRVRVGWIAIVMLVAAV